MTEVTINAEQGLYVIPCGAGYTCLGFDYAEQRRRAVLEWMRAPVAEVTPGTPEAYAAYSAAMAAGAEYAKRTGKRCDAELSPALKGLEGKRVEVTAPSGEKSRFWVGKSTGWIPCHLEVKRRDSMGGAAAYVPPGSTVTIVASR